MKKRLFYLTTFMLFMLSIISIKTNAQSFQKGNWNIDVDLGLGIYASETTSKISAFGLSFTDTEKDGTVSSIFRVGVEYGLSNKVGIGLKLGRSNYFIAEEDRDTLKSVKSTDFAIHFNFHLLNAERNDLFITLGLGGTSANWEYQTDPAIILESAKGSGGYFTFGVVDRIFFSDNVGMLFSLNFPFMSINVEPKLVDNANNFLSGVEYTWDMDMKLRGVYLGTGLAIKF